MGLPAPVPRRRLHTRRIACVGYRRDDGLWDIEAHIVDTKTYAYDEPMRGAVAAGSPVHDMSLRLTVDDDKIVRDIEVSTDAAPYGPCFEVAPNFKGLIGSKVGAGWRRAIHEYLGGVKSCTHLRELLLPVGTVVFQTLGGWRRVDGAEAATPAKSGSDKPHQLDGCMAWASDGDVVAKLLPEYFQGHPAS